MNRFSMFFLFAASICMSVFFAGKIQAQNIELLPGNNPHVFLSNFTVSQGEHLVVHPGAVLLFGEGANLIINGSCTVSGTPTAPIIFSSVSDTSESTIPENPLFWGGMIFDNAASVSIEYAKLKFAGNSGATQNHICMISNSNVTFRNTRFSGDNYKGIMITGNSSADFGSAGAGGNEFIGFEYPRYAIENYTSSDLYAKNNCWDGADIASIVFDNTDNSNYGSVSYLPAAESCASMIPEIPVLNSPVDGATGTPRNQYLKWNSVNDAQTYKIEVSESADMSNPVMEADVSENKKSFYSEEYGRKYFWRVKAENTVGSGNWSSIFEFTVYDTACPQVPEKMYPGESQIMAGSTVNLGWSLDPTASEYQIQVFDPDITSDYIIDTYWLSGVEQYQEARFKLYEGGFWKGGTVEIPGLEKGKEYAWRVRGKNENGYGEYSELQSFTTAGDIEYTYASSGRQMLNCGDYDNDGTVEAVCRINNQTYISELTDREFDWRKHIYTDYIIDTYWLSGVEEISTNLIKRTNWEGSDYIIDTFWVDTPLSQNDANSACFGDFNMDGVTDVATFGQTSQIHIKTGSGFSSHLLTNCPGLEKAVAIDFNMDGMTDIIGYDDRQIGMIKQTELDYIIDTYWVDMDIHDILLRDFNGDAMPDIIVPGDDNGDEKTKLYTISGGSLTLDAIIDGRVLNLELKDDYSRVYTIAKDGQLYLQTGSNIKPIATGNYDKAFTCDTDCDGVAEIVARSASSGTFEVYRLNEGIFEKVVDISGVPSGNIFQTDFDDNNTPDFFVSNADGVAYLKNTYEGNVPDVPGVINMNYSYSGDDVILEWDCSAHSGTGDYIIDTFWLSGTRRYQVHLVAEDNTPLYSILSDTKYSRANDNSATCNRDFFVLKNPEPGTYFWKVRTVSPSGNVSEFTETDILYTQGISAEPPACWLHEKKTGANATVIITNEPRASYEDRELAPGDAVGVFYQNGSELVCGGYAIVKENGNIAMTAWGDNKITDKVKDGFLTNEELKFKLWDAVNERELPAYGMLNDTEAVFGKDKRYYVNKFGKADTLNLAVPPGKVVMVSSNIVPFQKYIGDIVGESGILLSNKNGTTFNIENPEEGLMYFDFKKGYKAWSRSGQELQFYGKQVNPEEIAINLHKNSSLIIPYPYSYSGDCEDFLRGIESEILAVKDDEGRYYIPSKGINDIKAFVPNKAYEVLAANDAELTYPEAPKVYSGSFETAEFERYLPAEYYTGSTMCVVLECADLEKGDEVIVKNSIGRLYGSAISMKGRCAVTVWGDNKYTDEVEAAVEGERLFVEIHHKSLGADVEPEILSIRSLTSSGKDELVFTENNILEVKAEMAGISGIEDTTEDNTVEIYPTPASDFLNIRINTDSKIQSSAIFDMSGKKVDRIEFGAFSGTIKHDIKNLQDGVYIIRTVIDNKTYENKIVIQKD